MAVTMDFDDDDEPVAETPQKSKSEKADMSSSNLPSFMKTGSASHSAIAHEEAKAKQRQEAAQRTFRFRISQDDLDTEHQITFLDGDLDDEGLLVIPTWFEHTVKVAGNWTNLVCTGGKEPCPICEAGNTPALVGGLTVIDHTPYTIKNGKNEGKVIEKSRKLFVAKRGSIGIMQKWASKKGGLRGTTFDVSRTSGKSPSVGDMFDFVDGPKSLKDLVAEFGEELAVPADWAEEITYRTRDELIDLGVSGAAGGTIGGGSKGKNAESYM
jgi:hypothetical protein